jgi:hypothetical protein
MKHGEGNHLFRCEVFPPQTPPFLATTKGLAALWTLAIGASFGFLGCWLTGLGEISGMALSSIPCLAYGREACIEGFGDDDRNVFGEHFVYTVTERSRSNEIEDFS